MAVVSSEIEISSSLSASTLFKIYTNMDTIGPKVDPQTYKSVNVIEGDGGVGTIKSITHGNGSSSSKYKVDAIDTTNLMISTTFFEGNALFGVIDTATNHVKFIPSVDGGSVYKHTLVFKFHSDIVDVKTDDYMNRAKEAIQTSFKKIESYAIAHPEAY